MIVNDTHGPCQCVALDNFAQLVPPFLAELLGVVEYFVVLIGRQDDGGRIHRPGQTAASGFVTAGLDDTFMKTGE